MMTADEQFTKLAVLTPGYDANRWRRILEAPAQIQALELANLRDQDWSTPQASQTLSEILAVLTVIGTIAGVVGGVAGAASAVQVLSRGQ